MSSLNIISWNVRGLNTPVKRTRCLEFLNRKSVSIALIQESHLKEADVNRFQNKNYKLLAYSCASSKTKGVLILAKRSLQVAINLAGGDDLGRFVYAVITVHHTKYLLSSIYAPNDPDQHFFNNIIETLLQFSDHNTIIGGDFNASIHLGFDRSSNTPNSSASLSSSLLNTFVTEMNVVDPWRIQNPLVKEYTFYSSRHKSFSRIDYIFVSTPLLQCFNSIDILPILISDHSPIICTITPVSTAAKPCRWRFNDSLLYDRMFLDQLKTGLVEFLELNTEQCPNPQILWEVTKCFIRGYCIAFSSKAKRLKNIRFIDLEEKIKSLEHEQA